MTLNRRRTVTISKERKIGFQNLLIFTQQWICQLIGFNSRPDVCGRNSRQTDYKCNIIKKGSSTRLQHYDLQVSSCSSSASKENQTKIFLCRKRKNLGTQNHISRNFFEKPKLTSLKIYIISELSASGAFLPSPEIEKEETECLIHGNTCYCDCTFSHHMCFS